MATARLQLLEKQWNSFYKRMMERARIKMDRKLSKKAKAIYSIVKFGQIAMGPQLALKFLEISSL